MENTLEIKARLSDFILETLKSYEFKNSISSYIKDEIKCIVFSKKEDFFITKTYKDIKVNIKINMINSIKTGSFKEEVFKLLDYNLQKLEKSNKTLDKVIPPAFINGLKVYIYNHKDEMIDSFKKLITSKDVSSKINKEIVNVLNGINPMVSRFINANTIQDKLIAGINDYLEDPKNVEGIVNIINSRLDEFMEKTIAELAAYFPAEGRKSLLSSIANGIVDNLFSEKLIDTTLNMFEEKLKEYVSSLNKDSRPFISGLEHMIDILIENYYNNFLGSPKSQELIDEFSSQIVNEFLQKPLKDFI